MSNNKKLRKKLGRVTSEHTLPDLYETSDSDYFIFSFRYLHKDYGLEHKNLTKYYKLQLLSRLVRTTNMTWLQLELKNKKDGGIERIPKECLKKSLPYVVTDDIDKLYVLRFASQQCRLIGFRRGNIFFVLFIDPDLSLYNH